MKMIQLVLKSLLCFAIMFSNVVSGARNELVTKSVCVCLGETFTYECSVVGGLFTVWRGSVIGGNCEVTLIHSEYNQDSGSSAGCSNGVSVIGQSVSALNGCYVSTLSIEVSPGIDGSTVECNRDDGVETTLIGSTNIQITRSPAPPPESIHVSVNNGEINIMWLPVNYSCPSLSYSFTTSTSCGRCIRSADSTAVSCSAFAVSTTPTACRFSVRSSICGNITGEPQSTVINLQVPGAPLVQAVPQYLNGRIRSLTKLITTFAYGDHISISDDVDGSALYFNITYSDATFSSVCGSFSIPASSCVAGTCRHTFNILEASSCPATTSIVTTLYASNVLGRGPSSAFVTRDGVNSLVDVSFSQEHRSIVCSFINQPTAALKNCSANITFGENCDQLLGVYSTMSTGSTVRTPLLDARAGITDYCFVVTASSNNVTIMVEGNLVNIGSTSSNAATAAAVALTVILLAIVIAAVVFIVLLLKLKVYQKSGISELPHSVTFSVKDKLSVSKAFGVFEECHIKLEGVNTEESTTGFKIIHVKCSCSSTTAQKLEDGLRAEGATNVNILRLCTQNSVSEKAIQYLVRDQVGALAGTFKVFTSMNLKISGVNIDHLGEADRSTRVNYIECFADDQLLEKLTTTLKSFGVTCVNESDDTDQNYRILKITLPNESWSLNKTLKAFPSSNIDVHGVNVVHPASPAIDHPIVYKHYHVEIVATHKQFAQLSDALYSKGVATDVKEFRLSSESPQHYQGSQVNEDNFTPRTMMVEFFVRNEEGALTNALKIFGELGINIFKINPMHMADHHQSQFVEFSCEEGKRDALLRIILSYGATKAEFLSESELPPSVTERIPHYCVVKCSVGSKLLDVLKAFPKIGAEVTTINPPRIKQLHQYVECCCAEATREKLLSNLRSIRGVMDVKPLPQNYASGTQPDNYYVIKFSVYEEAGILFKALKAFFALHINVIGINTLKPAFKIEETRIYKENHIVFLGTDEQEKELIKKLLATGLAIDVKPYEPQTHHGIEVQVIDQVIDKTDDESKV